MTGTKGNARPIGYRARHSACLDATGLTPPALAVIVAVMAHERVYGISPTGSDVRAFLGVHDLSLNELVGGLWLTVEGFSNGGSRKRLTARARAWQTLGFSRDERRSA
jgi:hypothetical protein